MFQFIRFIMLWQESFSICIQKCQHPEGPFRILFSFSLWRCPPRRALRTVLLISGKRECEVLLISSLPLGILLSKIEAFRKWNQRGEKLFWGKLLNVKNFTLFTVGHGIKFTSVLYLACLTDHNSCSACQSLSLLQCPPSRLHYGNIQKAFP